MKRYLKRVLAILLAFLLTPVQYVSASSEFQLIAATASELFGSGQCEIELLEYIDRYYISIDGVSTLLDCPYQNKGGQYVFTGQKTDLKADFTGVGFVEYNGNRWYLLEDALNEVQIYATASKDGDGVLYYNSVFTNIDRLLAELDTIMSKDYFSADLLREMGFVGKLANFFANAYEITTNLRLDFFWGNAYSEDMANRIMELLQPIGTEDNLFDKIKSTNSKFNKAAKAILKAEDIYEDWREIINDIPAGGDALLFGIEGTQYIRDALEASREINKLDVLEFMVEAQLGKSGLKEYKDVLKNVSGIDLSGIDTYGFSDLLGFFSYIADTTQISLEYANALSLVLKYADTQSTTDTMNQYYRDVIFREGTTVLTDYNNYVHQQIIAMGGTAILDIVNTMKNNAGESILKTALFGKGAFGVTLFSAATNFLTGTNKKTNAVRYMNMYNTLQTMFKDCYIEIVEKGVSNTDEAILCRSAGLLYLKAAWHSVDGFSFDTGNNTLLDAMTSSAGIPTQRLKTTIEDAMRQIENYSDEMLTVATNKEIFPVGTFFPVEINRQFEIVCRPDITDSQIESVFQLPIGYEERYVICNYEIRDKETHESVRKFGIPFEKEYIDFYDQEPYIVAYNRDYLIFEILVGPGEWHVFNYNLILDRITDMSELAPMCNFYPVNDDYLLALEFVYSTEFPSYLDLYSMDGSKIETLVDYGYIIWHCSYKNKVYYSYSKEPTVWNSPDNVFDIWVYDLDSGKKEPIFSLKCYNSVTVKGALEDKLVLVQDGVLCLYSFDGQFINEVCPQSTYHDCFITEENIYYCVRAKTAEYPKSDSLFEIWEYQPSNGRSILIFSIECAFVQRMGNGFIEYYDNWSDSELKTVYW